MLQLLDSVAETTSILECCGRLDTPSGTHWRQLLDDQASERRELAAAEARCFTSLRETAVRSELWTVEHKRFSEMQKDAIRSRDAVQASFVAAAAHVAQRKILRRFDLLLTSYEGSIEPEARAAVVADEILARHAVAKALMETVSRAAVFHAVVYPQCEMMREESACRANLHRDLFAEAAEVVFVLLPLQESAHRTYIADQAFRSLEMMSVAKCVEYLLAVFFSNEAAARALECAFESCCWCSVESSYLRLALIAEEGTAHDVLCNYQLRLLAMFNESRLREALAAEEQRIFVQARAAWLRGSKVAAATYQSRRTSEAAAAISVHFERRVAALLHASEPQGRGAVLDGETGARLALETSRAKGCREISTALARMATERESCYLAEGTSRHAVICSETLHRVHAGSGIHWQKIVAEEGLLRDALVQSHSRWFDSATEETRWRRRIVAAERGSFTDLLTEAANSRGVLAAAQSRHAAEEAARRHLESLLVLRGAEEPRAREAVTAAEEAALGVISTHWAESLMIVIVIARARLVASEESARATETGKEDNCFSLVLRSAAHSRDAAAAAFHIRQAEEAQRELQRAFARNSIRQLLAEEQDARAAVGLEEDSIFLNMASGILTFRDAVAALEHTVKQLPENETLARLALCTEQERSKAIISERAARARDLVTAAVQSRRAEEAALEYHRAFLQRKIRQVWAEEADSRTALAAEQQEAFESFQPEWSSLHAECLLLFATGLQRNMPSTIARSNDALEGQLLSELLSEEAAERSVEIEFEFISSFHPEFGLCWQSLYEEEILYRRILTRTQLRELFSISSQQNPH
jgi:hypothetical protein